MTEPPAAPAISRRALISAAVAVAGLAAVGIPAALQLTAPTDTPAAARTLFAGRGGKLLTPLLSSRPFSVAHRGGSNDWPEMSLQAYTHSAKLGVNALEISLARTVDGVWFGLHDETLDRTSATVNFVAAEHTWAEVSSYRISAAVAAARTSAAPNSSAQTSSDPALADPGQSAAGQSAAQPYLRFTELVSAFGSTHTIFVDPKFVAPRHYPELLELMAQGVDAPRESFVAKSLGTDQNWGPAARAKGFHTFGFYYVSRGDATLDSLAATHGRWDLLGMQFDAGEAAWARIESLGKPVIGHIVSDRPEARAALSHGAVGLIVSGVREVLGATPPATP
ncbi:MAG: hypothetical protein H7248_05635 [Microbacteriaceae bacterium]|nr:hypothetical protein [Microbacteriaceae bacterium]